MIAVQARVVTALMLLRERHGDECVAVVSHGDVIRAAVAHCLGAPLDLLLRFEIGTASVTVVDFTPDGPFVRCVNSRGVLADPRGGS
jgi:probable phosphoglycerate mutase